MAESASLNFVQIHKFCIKLDVAKKNLFYDSICGV